LLYSLPRSLKPDLVVVTSGTMPHLNLVSRNDLSISQVHALMLISPSNPIIARQRELLISISRTTSPDLQLVPVGSRPAGDVEALVPEHDQLVSAVIPRLISKSSARLDNNSSSIRVGRGRQTGIMTLLGADCAKRRSGDMR